EAERVVGIHFQRGEQAPARLILQANVVEDGPLPEPRGLTCRIQAYRGGCRTEHCANLEARRWTPQAPCPRGVRRGALRLKGDRTADGFLRLGIPVTRRIEALMHGHVAFAEACPGVRESRIQSRHILEHVDRRARVPA